MQAETQQQSRGNPQWQQKVAIAVSRGLPLARPSREGKTTKLLQ